MIGPLRDLSVAGAVLVGIHYAIIGPGAYAFARGCGANRRFSALCALAFLCNNFLFYWFASSWFSGLVSLTWTTWALFGVVSAHRGRFYWIAAAVFTAMTVSAGWPHATIVVGIFTLVVAAARWREQGLRRALAPATAAALGFVLALVSALPLVAAQVSSARPGGIFNGVLFGTDLYAALDASGPLHLGNLFVWSHDRPLLVPYYFVSWYVVPFLPLLNWSRDTFRSYNVTILLAFSAILLVMTQGPEQLGPLRWPFRFLPFLDLVLLATFSVLASRAGFASASLKRVAAALSLIAFSCLASFQAQPIFLVPIIALASILSLLLLSGVLLQRRGHQGYFGVATLGTLACFAATHLAVRHNPSLPNWGLPSRANYNADLEAVPNSYTAFIGSINEVRERHVPFISIGAMPFAQGYSSPFGYSPTGQRDFSGTFGLSLWGTVAPKRALAITQPSMQLGVPWVDLLHVDRLLVFRAGDRPRKVARALSADWHVAGSEPYIVTFARRTIPLRVGSLATSTPGLVLAEIGHGSAEREAFRVGARSGHNDTLVFDRIPWPGYKVEFNGKSLPFLTRYRELLTVHLPDGPQRGLLVISYQPPFIKLGLMLSAFAALCLGLGAAYWDRLFRRTTTGSVQPPDRPVSPMPAS